MRFNTNISTESNKMDKRLFDKCEIAIRQIKDIQNEVGKRIREEESEFESLESQTLESESLESQTLESQTLESDCESGESYSENSLDEISVKEEPFVFEVQEINNNMFATFRESNFVNFFQPPVPPVR